MEENNIPKVYDPKSFEKKWYGFWEENKLFHAVVEEEKEPYSIVIPPPNVTGQLHICLSSTSPSPRDGLLSRMPSTA